MELRGGWSTSKVELICDNWDDSAWLAVGSVWSGLVWDDAWMAKKNTVCIQCMDWIGYGIVLVVVVVQ